MRPDALVVIESTVPVGTCEHVVLPLLRRERLRRGITAPVLLAHAYERVMPGPRYVDSIRRYPRSFSGVDAASAERARAFLSTFVDTESHPLCELADSTSSELGKLLENSYRAANIAFVHEWTLLAEQIGVNLFDVVDSIRVRAGTHDNMRYPGFGVGGYCLTKDSLLAQWGASNLLGSDVVLGTTLAALRTNQLMPLHTVDLTRELAGGDLSGCTVAVAGVSYLPDVADTRDAPAALLVDALDRAGAEVRVHDPHVREWAERPGVPIAKSLAAAVEGTDGIVFAVPHGSYLGLEPGELTALAGRPGFVVDAQNIVSDEKAEALRATGWRLLGVGKGHWRKRGYEAPS
jgi:nucleotide sugar dehydrogenase